MLAESILNLLDEKFIVKESGDFFMYGYKDRNQLTPESSLLNNIITDKNKKILHYSGPFMEETSSVDGALEVYSFPEGTLLRLFFYNGEWKIATNRCLDASKSYFMSSISFLDMFKEIAEENFFDKLDKNFCYCCILKHTGARVVLPVYKNEVVIVSKTNLENLETTFNKDYKTPDLNQDSLVINKDGKFFRVFSNKYIRMRELKKINNNNPVSRVVDLITKETGDTKEFLEYFPEYMELYYFVFNNLEDFCKKVLEDYINLKIKKEQIHFPKIYYMLLCRIHGEYIRTRNPTTIETVRKFVYETDTKSLRLMVFSEFLNESQQNEIKKHDDF